MSQKPKKPHLDISVCWYGSAGVSSHLPWLWPCWEEVHCRRTSQKVPGAQDGCFSNRNSMAVRPLLQCMFRNTVDWLKLSKASRASFPMPFLRILGQSPHSHHNQEQNVNICRCLSPPRGKSFSCCCILDFTICFFSV